MALPSGVSTFTLQFGRLVNTFGGPMGTRLTVEPSHELVWAATGDRISAVSVVSAAVDGEFGVVQLPHTDQPGFVDLNGNAITDFWYTVRATDVMSGRVVSAKVTRHIQATSDIGFVDLEMIPVDTVVAPAGSVPLPAVTSVNGQTGAVVVDVPAASPEQIEQAVTDWLSENPVEGVTQAELDAAVAGLARSADLAEVATSGAYTDLDGLPVLDFAPTVHTHAQSDVDGLTDALGSKVDTDDSRLSDARTPVAHTHEIGDVTGLEDALANAGGGGGGLSGTGTPEGVHTATVGTIYTDTAATTGAIRWIKASGTGNTGWKVLYGDTGWRRVTDAGVAGGVTSAVFNFRRIGYVVEFNGRGVNGATTGYGYKALQFPLGFTPHVFAGTRNDLWWWENYIAWKSAFMDNVTRELRLAGATPGAGFSMNLTYSTVEAWPAVLPGTPV